MTAGQREHIELLESMAQLNEAWTKPIKQAIEVLKKFYDLKVEQTVTTLVEYMVKSLSFVHKQKIKGEKATPKEEEVAKEVYRNKILEYEKREKREIEKIWQHTDIQKAEEELNLEEMGLFSKESASIFGLSQKELILTGASAGAITGGGLDLLVAGSSLFLGTLIGGVVGGVGAMYGFNNLYELKVLGQSVGRRELSVGPMQNLNFPYVLLGRALYHASLLAKRSHATRGAIDLQDASFTEEVISSEARKILEKVHVKLRKGKELNNEELEEYSKTIYQSFLTLLN